MSYLPPQINGVFPTTGVKTRPDGNPGVRQPLRVLKEDKELWDLFLMGLWALQKVPQYRDLSFYKLAGIHGMPYVCWPPRDKDINAMFKLRRGFCTHSSIIFLPWHRPYLALYEQMIFDAIEYVVSKFSNEPNMATYKAKAPKFRLPFWDWAVTRERVFPDEMVNKLVDLPIPKNMRAEYGLKMDGDTVTVHNPLHSYEFGTDTEDEKDLLVWGARSTQRYAKKPKDEEKDKLEEQSEEDTRRRIEEYVSPYSKDVNSALRPEGNLRERVVYLVQSYNDFSQVSHNMWDPNRQAMSPEELPFPGATPETFGKGFGSIEDIHNVVHGLVGGMGEDFNGHMANVEIASFDPIFWLHHCNIDRIFAIWQGLHDDPKNPKSYVTPQKAGGQSWTREVGDQEAIDTKLIPFYKDAKSFWTAQDVRDTAALGYAYPETQKWCFKSEADYRADILKQLSKLYPNASLATIMSDFWHDTQDGKDSEAALRERGRRLAQVSASSSPDNTATALTVQKDKPSIHLPDRNLKKLASDGTYFEYMFNIKAPKHVMDGKYTIHVFIGKVQEENTALYTVSPNHIGTFSPLGQRADTACGKCQTDMAAKESVTSQIPLTIALVERYFAGFLADLEIDTVVKYLTENIHWEVLDNFGQRLLKQRDKVTGLKCSVSSNEVTIPKTHGQPSDYSPMVKYHYQITTNKDGTGRAEGTGMTYKDLYGPQDFARGEGVVIEGRDDADEGS